MRKLILLFVIACLVGCERAPEPSTTAVSPESATPEPAASRKPKPPKTSPTPEPEEVEPEAKDALPGPVRWVYPTAEMFEGDAPSALAKERFESLGEQLIEESARVRIVTHTDTRGSGAYNLKKSQQRADLLRALLVEGHPKFAERIEAVGRGEEVAPADGEPASRVVVTLTYEDL